MSSHSCLAGSSTQAKCAVDKQGVIQPPASSLAGLSPQILPLALSSRPARIRHPGVFCSSKTQLHMTAPHASLVHLKFPTSLACWLTCLPPPHPIGTGCLPGPGPQTNSWQHFKAMAENQSHGLGLPKLFSRGLSPELNNCCLWTAPGQRVERRSKHWKRGVWECRPHLGPAGTCHLPSACCGYSMW